MIMTNRAAKRHKAAWEGKRVSDASEKELVDETQSINTL
jgi:hypothetical protein